MLRALITSVTQHSGSDVIKTTWIMESDDFARCPTVLFPILATAH